MSNRGSIFPVTFFQKEFSLDDVSSFTRIAKDACASYTEALGKRASDTTLLAIQLEEIILRFKDTYTANTPCTLKGHKRFGSVFFEISKRDQEIDPLQIEEGMRGARDILASVGEYPRYNYTHRNGGSNKITITVPTKKRKNSMLVNVAISVALAIICYFLLQLLPGDTTQFLADGIISPVFSKLIFVLTEVATIFVFFAIIAGILGIGDASAFGKMGKTFSGGMLVSYGIAALILLGMGLTFFGTSTTGSSEGESPFAEIFALVLDIIPNNLIEPFSTDNSMQVIVIAIFFGVIILILGDKVKHFQQVILEAADVVNHAMIAIMKAIPLIVFFGILHMLYTVNLSSLYDVYLMAIAFVIGALLVLLITIIRVRITTKAPFSVIFKKQLPALIINLATSSQVSAMPDTIDCCKNRFGIDGHFVDFAVPLGVVIFMPCGAVFIGLTAWSLAAAWGVSVTVAVVAKIILASIIVAIAAPPIPGSGLAVLPIMFAVCGLPGDAMPVAIIITTVIGYFLPAFNGLMIELQILLSAHKLGIVDNEVLCKPWSQDQSDN